MTGLDERGCSELFLQYVLEADAKLDQLRVLVESADREKLELLNQLEEEKRCGGHPQLNTASNTLPSCGFS